MPRERGAGAGRSDTPGALEIVARDTKFPTSSKFGPVRLFLQSKVCTVSEELHPEEPASAPRRKAAVTKKHTVGRVILMSSIALALVTSLGIVYLVRHLDENIVTLPLGDVLGEKPEKDYHGNGEPLNIVVMGDDSRDCDGCKIDGEGGGGRSDTTILIHLSGDRSRAYAVSIPRDSIVDRPDKGCGAAASDVMWNEAYSVGGPQCTASQIWSTTGVYPDHFVVVDFNGFGNMVDAVGGVPVCVPEDIDDPEHEIFVPAGDPSLLTGDEALDYVRARYVGELLQQNDLSRIKRQQTFIAALVREVKSAGTLTRLDKVVSFLDAATETLTTDEELGSVTRLGKLGMQLQGIGLENVKFVTLPTEYYSRDSDHWGKVFWTEDATTIWGLISDDKPLPRNLLSGSISAEPPATSVEAQEFAAATKAEKLDKKGKKAKKAKNRTNGKSKGLETKELPSESPSESPSEVETTEPPSEPAAPSETSTPAAPPTPTKPEEQIPGVCA